MALSSYETDAAKVARRFTSATETRQAFDFRYISFISVIYQQPFRHPMTADLSRFNALGRASSARCRPAAKATSELPKHPDGERLRVRLAIPVGPIAIDPVVLDVLNGHQWPSRT